MLALLTSSCGNGTTLEEAADSIASILPPPKTLDPPEPYTPIGGEPVPEVKQLAADVLQAIGTYKVGEGTLELANARIAGRAAPGVAEAVSALLVSTAASAVDIIYPQLSGLTQNEAGIMLVFRQRLLENGDERSMSRTADLRFRRSANGWILSEAVPLAPQPPAAPVLSAAARSVLDNDRIRLPETARWDVEAGTVDERLLNILLDIAGEHTVDVTVFATGHPRNVFGSRAVSNHTVGRAVDIWAVDDVEVISQRDPAGPLRALAATFLTKGVTELGTPWDLDGPAAGRSFTNTVHEDHLHVGFDRSL